MEPDIIRCGHCERYHATTAQVRVCGTGVYIDPDTGQAHTGAWLCDWLLQEWVIDGYTTWECHAPSWKTEHGYTCAAGHEHYSLQAQYDLGIVYATEDEAASLHRAGRTVLMMDGSSYVPGR